MVGTRLRTNRVSFHIWRTFRSFRGWFLGHGKVHGDGADTIVEDDDD